MVDAPQNIEVTKTETPQKSNVVYEPKEFVIRLIVVFMMEDKLSAAFLSVIFRMES